MKKYTFLKKESRSCHLCSCDTKCRLRTGIADLVRSNFFHLLSKTSKMSKTIKVFPCNLQIIIGNSSNKQNKFHKILKANEPLNVLDLGCRVPLPFTPLDFEYDCNLLVGVDKENEKECIQSFLSQVQKDAPKDNTLAGVNAKEIVDFYQLFKKMYPNLYGNDTDYDTKEKFDEKYLSSFKNSTIKEFLVSTTEKFDIIIAKNVLHFFKADDLKEILQMIKNIMNKNCILFIRVQKGGNFNYEKFKEDFIDLFENAEITEYYSDLRTLEYSMIFNKSNLLD